MPRNKFTFSLTAEAIDRASGVLNGVSMVTIGPVRGHGTYADLRTLETVRECAETHTTGLQVKMDHGGGARDIVGTLKSYRIDGQQLRANLHLLQKSPHYDHLLEMCELMPGSFGLSVSFSGDHQTIEIADGLKVDAMRCREIYSCDVVDSPAANPNGLFSMTPPKPKDAPAVAPTEPAAPVAGTFSVSADQWAELNTGLGILVQKLTAAVAAMEAMNDGLPKQFEALTAKVADAELVALRRLSAMGVPAGTVPSVQNPAPAAPPKTWREQLDAIPADHFHERREFMRLHKNALYAELAQRQ